MQTPIKDGHACTLSFSISVNLTQSLPCIPSRPDLGPPGSGLGPSLWSDHPRVWPAIEVGSVVPHRHSVSLCAQTWLPDEINRYNNIKVFCVKYKIS